ncbi:dicarboxylate/amino acid:cation symporter [Endozoicomonas sp. ONNA2]|uniref:dicarboxylate/amino acid:cation symporter n=1 Tax=Endozoicomonas sp. ONNA2 TaxID=2828741 RepID=UPI0021472081|nr:dicarboxylate/amino acid:cation symporter [Endozoicomonas sp. ONNA2]
MMQKNLAPQILIALILGMVTGIFIQLVASPEGIAQQYLVSGLFHAIGVMFVAMIKMLVVPLIFVSIAHAVCSLNDISQVGRLGVKTFGIYLGNTLFAILSAMVITSMIAPGTGANLGHVDQLVRSDQSELPSLLNMIINVVPTNPFQALAEGNILQILFMAIITGVAIKKLENHETHSVSNAISLANSVMMKLIGMVMSMAPFGVFFLTAKLAATLNGSSILSVLSYVLTCLLIMCLWLFVIYPVIIGLVIKRSPLVFIRHTREQVIFALSTASSNASIPITYQTLIEKFKVPEHIAGFTVPLGATINMSGSAIYMSVAALFVANAWHVDLSFLEMGTMGFTIFLLAVATGGIPGGAAVSTGVLLHTMGLPVEAMAIILATDRITDAGCTVTNVVGNTVAGILCSVGETTPETSGENSTGSERVALDSAALAGNRTHFKRNRINAGLMVNNERPLKTRAINWYNLPDI